MIYAVPSMALITFGFWEVTLVFGVIVMLFGAKKLPLLARGLGAGIRNFKGELQAPEEPTDDDDDDE